MNTHDNANSSTNDSADDSAQGDLPSPGKLTSGGNGAGCANPANSTSAGHSHFSPNAVLKAASAQPQPQLRQPWYREPLMWLVLGLPASVVLACVITGVVIYQSPDRLVVQPHHKVGLKVERRG